MAEKRKEKTPLFHKEWNALPFVSQQRLPITATIPYFYRWKINQIKLMLSDLDYLAEKHEIEAAHYLYKTVVREAELLFEKLQLEIETKRKEIEVLKEVGDKIKEIEAKTK